MHLPPPRWLRWQLTQRGGLLWHETCETCAAWSEPTEDGYGSCAYNHTLDTHRNDACSRYEAKDDTECASPWPSS